MHNFLSYFLYISLLLNSCGSSISQNDKKTSQKKQEESGNTPQDPKKTQIKPIEKLYFMFVLHLDVQVDPQGNPIDVEDSYKYTKQIIEHANSKNIKLTLMFTPPWVDYISKNSDVKADVLKWKSQGHELAAHNHDVWHPGAWYGYTNLPTTDRKQRSEPYIGDMNAFMTEMKKIDPNIRVGCLNDERHKKDFPDEIVVDTCSGFYNYGTEGKWKVGDDAPRGKMEWKYTGTINNIKRTWLTHSALMVDTSSADLINELKNFSKGFFGVVSHANSIEYDEYIKFMDSIAISNPNSSVTVSEAASSNIETKTLTENQLGSNGGTSEPFPPSSGDSQNPGNVSSPCGDGKCDERERADRNLCPQDYDLYCN